MSGVMSRPAVFSPYSRSPWTSSDFSSFMRSSTFSACSAGSSSRKLGGVVRPHPVEDARDLALVERSRELVHRLVSQLGQHRPGRFAAEQAEERHLIGEGELAQGRRDVRGVGVLEDLVEALAASRLQQIPDGVGEPDRLAHDDGTRRGAARGPAASATAARGRAGPR